MLAGPGSKYDLPLVDTHQKPLSFAMVLSVAYSFCHSLRTDGAVRVLVMARRSHVVAILKSLEDLYNQVLEFHASDTLPAAFQPWYQNKAASAKLLSKIVQTLEMYRLAHFVHFCDAHSNPIFQQQGGDAGSGFLQDLISFGVASTSAIALLDAPRLLHVLRTRHSEATIADARNLLSRLHFNMSKFESHVTASRDATGRVNYDAVLADAGSNVESEEPELAIEDVSTPDDRQSIVNREQFHLMDDDKKLIIWLDRHGLGTSGVRNALVKHGISELDALMVIMSF